MLHEIMQFLEENIDDIDYEEDGTGGNIFQNILPTEPDECVMVRNTGGFPKDMRHAEYFEPSIQIYVRGTQDPRVGKELAQEIINIMGTLASMKFVEEGAEWRVIKSQAMQAMPIHNGRDDNNRHEFSTNFELEVQKIN